MEEPILTGKEPCVALTSSRTTSPENTAHKVELVKKASREPDMLYFLHCSTVQNLLPVEKNQNCSCIQNGVENVNIFKCNNFVNFSFFFTLG
jgi:hypothetical protein